MLAPEGNAGSSPSENPSRDREQGHRAGLWRAVLDPASLSVSGLDVDDACARLLGYASRLELAGLSLSTLFARSDDFTLFCRSLVDHLTLSGFETRVVPRAGPPLWVLVDARAVPDDKGSLRVQGILANVDRYKQTEQSLRESVAVLRAAQGRTRAILDSTLTMTALLTPEGIVLEANQAALDMSKLTPDDVIGKPFWATAWWEHSEQAQEEIRVGITRAAHGEAARFEIELQGPHRTATIDFSVRPIHDGAGSIVSLVAEGHDVSERRAAERARDESQVRYSQIVENAAEGIWLFDEHNHAEYVNPRGAAILGYTVEEAVHKSPLAFIFPEDRGWVREELVARARGEGEESELRLRHKDGSERWVHYTVTRRLDAQGHYLGVLALVTDVTEQHRAQESLRLLNAELESRVKERTIELESEVREHREAEDALRASEDRYRRLVELSPDGIFIHRGGRMLFVNPAGLRLFGATAPEQVIGKPLADFIHPEYRERVRERVREMVAEQRPVPMLEEVMLRLDGTPVSVEAVAVSLNDGAGSVQVVFRDIGERKRIMQELALAQERFRAALKHAPITVYNQDLDLRYSWAYNPAGITASEMVGKTARDLFPAQAGELDALSRNVITSGVGTRQEVRVTRADGYVRLFDLVVEPQKDAHGKVTGVIGASIDITEYRASEDRVRQLNAQLEKHAVELEAANRELESFSYSVSHDLRTPLASIDGFARLLSEECSGQLPEEGQRYLHLVRENTARMDRLIKDLLAFSRTSRQPLSREPVAPSTIVREILEEQRPATIGRKVEFLLEELPACEADAAMLKQVYVNLISNALKFTRKRDVAHVEIGFINSRAEADSDASTSPTGSPPEVLTALSPRLAAHPPDSTVPNPETLKPEVVYFVKDNGVGFDMDRAKRLFGVFQRLHREEDYEGTGVGLAIVERIIRRHGGRIWAESHVEQGAAFYFTLGSPS